MTLLIVRESDRREFSKEYNFEGNFIVDDESFLALFGLSV